MHEIETKVLEVDVENVKKNILALRAKEIQNTRLSVDWQFDLDQYPNMPAYLEIEGKHEEHIQEILKKLGLEGHEYSLEGERILIEKKYGLNWNEMRF